MDFLISIQYFAAPFAVLIITQILKFFIAGLGQNRWSLSTLTAYGGMPSTHTATVVSLTTVLGMDQGISSPIFGAALIFSGITIRDAIGFRQFLSQHSHLLNLLAEKHGGSKKHLPHVVEVIGHTPLEAMLGGILGFLLTLGLVSLLS